MSSWALSHYAFRSAATGIRRSPFIHGAAVGALAVVLFATGLVAGGSRWLSQVINGLGSEVELTVYLKEGTRFEEAQALAQALSLRSKGETQVVAPEQALARLVQELGPLGSALTGLPENPLPLSVEVKLPPKGRNPQALKQLEQELKRVGSVEAVDYGEAAVERLASMVRLLQLGGMLVTVIVWAITAVIVAATLQLAIYARRQEIEIQKLVGATDLFVQLPFLLQGIMQGLLGAALACASIWFLALGMGPRLAAALSFLAMGEGTAGSCWVNLQAFGTLFLLGAFLGLVGSFLAVARLSRN